MKMGRKRRSGGRETLKEREGKKGEAWRDKKIREEGKRRDKKVRGRRGIR